MKNSFSSVKNKIISRHIINDETNKKRTDINVLLNRVLVDKKRERRRKILFSASASLGLLLFGIIVF